MGMNALEVRRRVMLAQPHEAVASGAVASFRTDVVSALPMEFDLVPIQAGTGDPSPENIRPITGHDGFTRIRTGKNMLVKPFVYYSTISDDISDDYFYIKAGEYIISFETSTATNWRFGVRMFDLKGNLISDNAHIPYQYMSYYAARRMYLNGADTTQLSLPITIVEDCYIRFVWGFGDTTSSSVFSNVMLRNKTDDRTYESPNIHSYETTFPTPPGTVYGCHITDNGDGTGTLAVTDVIIDLGTLSWNYVDLEKKRFFASLAGVKRPATDSVVPNIYCTTYKPETYANVFNNVVNKSISIHNNNDQVAVYDTAYTDKNTFKTAMDGQKLVYPLATPVSYTLSLTAIQSLIGQNNVWVDNADSVSVEYWGH